MKPGRIYIDELRQRKKRRRKQIAFLVIFTIAAVAAGSVYALFFSGWFKVKGIEISGNKDLNHEEIRSMAENYINRGYLFGLIQPYSNILFAGSEAIEHALKNRYPLIESVDVNKNLLNKNLYIELKEREAIGVYCKTGAEVCFYFDRNNVLFKEAPRFSGNLFLVIEDGRNRDFKLGHSFDDAELLNRVFETKMILDELRPVEYDNFFLPENSFDFWLKTKGGLPAQTGWYIYLDKETNIADQLVALKKFLEEKLSPDRRQTIQYIDLRINNRIYYR